MKRRDWLVGAGASALVLVGATGPRRAGAAPRDAASRRPNLAAAPRGPSTLPRGSGPLPIGLQLYTVRGLLAEDLPGTLGLVAGIGYREVELAGLHGATPEAFRAHLDHAGLSAASSHVPIEAMRDAPDRLLADAATLGVGALVVPWLPPSERTPDGYRRVADDLNRAGERAAGTGIAVAYHNNDFEVAVAGGPSGWDVILDRTDPALVTMQMDVFWAVAGGADPLAYLREHAGRFTSVHAKDRTPSGDMVAVGEGVIDYAAILAAARAQGLTRVFVEHDDPRDPIASVRASYRTLKALEI